MVRHKYKKRTPSENVASSGVKALGLGEGVSMIPRPKKSNVKFFKNKIKKDELKEQYVDYLLNNTS